MSDSNSRLVYSTETGRIDEPKAAPVRPKGDGVVRIQRQTSGRKGKDVCLITGVDLDDAELTKLAAELKKKNAAAVGQLKMELLKSRVISAIY